VLAHGAGRRNGLSVVKQPVKVKHNGFAGLFDGFVKGVAR
jgi:hypothetical protein